MAIAVDGVVTISFRPLATMDELHILLLAAVSVQANEVSLLEQVFSLPSSVVVKELAVLEAYGLAQNVCDRWTATSRGLQLATVWNTFQKQVEISVQTSGLQWLLGPGEFYVDEMIRDMDEIESQARDLGVASAASALNFLDERRGTAERFESFVREWSSRANAATSPGKFADSIVFDNLRLAETDDALRRLEELLATHISEVTDRYKAKEADEFNADVKLKHDDLARSISKRGQGVLKKFEDIRRTQRREIQHLAKTKMICEAFLAAQWFAIHVEALVEYFNNEPAAFIFSSTVPVVEREAAIESDSPFASSHSHVAEPKREEGIWRALFRWFFS